MHYAEVLELEQKLVSRVLGARGHVIDELESVSG